MPSYIYLIQTGEYINTETYKIGRTTQDNGTRFLNRFNGYSKNTVQKHLREVPTEKVLEIENDIKKLFRNKFRLEKGSEWFCGDCQIMIADINTIICKYLISNNLGDKSKTDILVNTSKNQYNTQTIYNNEDKMKVFIKINENPIFNETNLRYWLNENCTTWIMLKNKPQICVICYVKSYKRFDSVSRSLKNTVKQLEKKGSFYLNPDFNILKTNQINNNNHFKTLLKKHFFPSDSMLTDSSFENIELNGYTKKYVISLLNNDEEITINVCSFCSKEYKSAYTKKRHEKTCKKKEEIDKQNASNNDPKNTELNIETVENIINDKIDTKMNDITKMLKEILSNQSSIINNTTNQ